MSDNSGRGNGFTRSENEYIVAKCLRFIAGKEKFRDIDIAKKLGRGKNNISIRRRLLGFSYIIDSQTGERKVVYERPKNKDMYVNIEKLDIAKAIASIEYKIAKTKLIKDGEDTSDIKLSDFYPEDEFEKLTEDKLNVISSNIVGTTELFDKDKDNYSDEDEYDEDVDYSDYKTLSGEKKSNKKREDIFLDEDFEDGIEYDAISDGDELKNNTEEDEIISGIHETNEKYKNENQLVSYETDKEEVQYVEAKYVEDDEEEYVEEEDADVFKSKTFLMTKKSLTPEEWGFFKERWKEYMDSYGDQFDEVSDWDDLTGYILEQIKKLRLMQKEKDYAEDYSKELSLCTTRLNDYKKNLATSRLSRIQQKVDTRLNIADIIKLFEDNSKYIELMYQAEIEVKGISDYIRTNLEHPENLKEFSKIDGNEAALLLGLPSSYEELSKLIDED